MGRRPVEGNISNDLIAEIIQSMEPTTEIMNRTGLTRAAICGVRRLATANARKIAYALGVAQPVHVGPALKKYSLPPRESGDHLRTDEIEYMLRAKGSNGEVADLMNIPVKLVYKVRQLHHKRARKIAARLGIEAAPKRVGGPRKELSPEFVFINRPSFVAKDGRKKNSDTVTAGASA